MKVSNRLEQAIDAMRNDSKEPRLLVMPLVVLTRLATEETARPEGAPSYIGEDLLSVLQDENGKYQLTDRGDMLRVATYKGLPLLLHTGTLETSACSELVGKPGVLVFDLPGEG